MADSYLERVAGELADLALADQAASGDIAIVDMIGEVLGASSQTLQEAYMTAIRVRRAEARAREILGQRLANNYALAARPAPAPLQGPADAEAEQKTGSDTDKAQTATDTPADLPPQGGMPRRVTR